MTWTDDEWDGFCHLLEEWWKDGLTDGKRLAWRLAIDDVDPNEAASMLKLMLRRGGTWRPSVAEFVEALEERRRGGTPSFDEAWPIIVSGLRRLRPGDDGAVAVAYVREHAGEHVAGWMRSYGVDRLKIEPTDDPEYGGAVMHRLRDHFSELMSRPESRDRLARALDAPARQNVLRRFDPAKALPEAEAAIDKAAGLWS